MYIFVLSVVLVIFFLFSLPLCPVGQSWVTRGSISLLKGPRNPQVQVRSSLNIYFVQLYSYCHYCTQCTLYLLFLYYFFLVLSDAGKLVHLLEDCREAMDIVVAMEQALFLQKVVILNSDPQAQDQASNVDLLCMEQSLLKLAAFPDLCGGILYFLPVKTDEYLVVRYACKIQLLCYYYKKFNIIIIITVPMINNAFPCVF